MEAVVSSIIALVLALKFTDLKSKKAEEDIRLLQERVERLSEESRELDQEMAKKQLQILLPVAKAVNRLNQEIGI